MGNVKKITVIVIVFYAFFLSHIELKAAENLDADDSLFITEESLFIYESEDMLQPAAVIPANGAGYILKENENTYEIESGGKRGFIEKKNFLQGKAAGEKAAKEFQKDAAINKNIVFVYESEELQGRIVGLLSAGDRVSITEENTEKDTLEIVTLDNLEGYIMSAAADIEPVYEYAEDIDWEEYYEKVPEAIATYSSSEDYDQLQGTENEVVTGDEIAAYACRFVGNSYVWGGESLTDGTDCSGFVKSVYGHYGVDLPRTSAEQRAYGTLVCEGFTEELARPGDLVGYDGHIAIYIGNGEIVHAANAEEGILISRADYRNALCVRRIIGNRQSILLTDEEKEILYRIVEAEAGGEDFQGKMLVTSVILNRMESSLFPDRLEEVVFQVNHDRYQFSPVSDGRYETVTISSDTKHAVNQALRGGDNAQGALYFMARNAAAKNNVKWFDKQLTRLFQHGNHEFFK